jgi:hypothetical protein
MLISGVILLGSCSTTEHYQVKLGVLMSKLPAGADFGFVFALRVGGRTIIKGQILVITNTSRGLLKTKSRWDQEKSCSLEWTPPEKNYVGGA